MYRCVTFWPVWTAEITLHNQNWLISPTHTAVHVRLMADGGGGGGEGVYLLAVQVIYPW